MQRQTQRIHQRAKTGAIDEHETGIADVGFKHVLLDELDALVNIDFETRTVKDALTSLDIIRLGTSGSVSEEIEVDSIIISETAIGLDGLLRTRGAAAGPLWASSHICVTKPLS